VDLVEGHVATLENLTEGVHFYIFGTGKGTSVLELVRAFGNANDIESLMKLSIVG
jgi:UDP-glucose 4-epimerase